ncbi:MAG: hypothetical protein ARM1_0036 [Candidatus Micrarchaeota archaeon]|nr:MAG: hypothetical protein ARM1_0036 [Candidatus Micrarchaeota archaeon]
MSKKDLSKKRSLRKLYLNAYGKRLPVFIWLRTHRRATFNEGRRKK